LLENLVWGISSGRGVQVKVTPTTSFVSESFLKGKHSASSFTAFSVIGGPLYGAIIGAGYVEGKA
jgi:hypothetical protein